MGLHQGLVPSHHEPASKAGRVTWGGLARGGGASEAVRMRSTCVCIVPGPEHPAYRQQPSQGAPPLLGNRWRMCGGGAGRRSGSARSGSVHNQARRDARPRAGASAAWGHRERTDEHGGTASSMCPNPKPPPCRGRASLRMKPSGNRPETRRPSRTRAAWAKGVCARAGAGDGRCAVCVCVRGSCSPGLRCKAPRRVDAMTRTLLVDPSSAAPLAPRFAGTHGAPRTEPSPHLIARSPLDAAR